MMITLIAAVLLFAENSITTLPFVDSVSWSQHVTPVACRMRVTSCPATIGFGERYEYCT